MSQSKAADQAAGDQEVTSALHLGSVEASPGSLPSGNQLGHKLWLRVMTFPGGGEVPGLCVPRRAPPYGSPSPETPSKLLLVNYCLLLSYPFPVFPFPHLSTLKGCPRHWGLATHPRGWPRAWILDKSGSRFVILKSLQLLLQTQRELLPSPSPCELGLPWAWVPVRMLSP